ncbi:hypothetical protein ABVT39_007108 [Epinephelus coioides]
MDKEAENMDNITSSLAFSMHTVISETINTCVSDPIDETVEEDDELMCCDDFLEYEEDTGPRPNSTISEESWTTYPSPWCCSPDSEISEVNVPFHQNIDELVTQVCQRFLFPEDLEEEAEVIQTPEPTEAVKTPDATEAVMTPEPTEAVRTPEPTEAVTTPEPTEAVMTVISETINTCVSDPIDETVEEEDELMCCDDLLEYEEDTGPRPYSTISEENWTTYPSPWCCSPDSEISEVNVPFHQKIDELVTQVCQRFLFPEDLEEEAGVVQTPEPTEAVMTVISETINTCVSDPIDETVEEEDELMCRDDLLEYEEDTGNRPYSTISEENWTTYPSPWCCSPDSKISEVNVPFHQKIDELVTQVCQRFLFPEDLEEEAGVVQTPEPTEAVMTVISETINTCVSDPIDETVEEEDELMCRDDLLEYEEDTGNRPYSTISEENWTTYPSPWCCSPDSKISEVNVPFHQKIDELVTQVCQRFLFPEDLEEEAEVVQTPEPTETVMTPESTETVTTPEPTQAVMTPEVTEVIEFLTEDIDVTPEIGELVPSPPSASSLPSALVEIPQPQSQLLAKIVTDFDEDVRRSPSLRTLGGQSGGTRKKLQWRRYLRGWQRQKIHPAPLEHFEEAVRSASTPCSKETSSTTSCSSSLKDHMFIPLKLEDYNEDEDQAPEDTLMCLSLPDHQVAEVTPLAEAMIDEVTQKISTCQGSVDRSQLTEYVSNNQTDDHETKATRSNIFSRFFSNIFSKNEKKEEKKKPSADNLNRRTPFWKRLVLDE